MAELDGAGGVGGTKPNGAWNETPVDRFVPWRRAKYFINPCRPVDSLSNDVPGAAGAEIPSNKGTGNVGSSGSGAGTAAVVRGNSATAKDGLLLALFRSPIQPTKTLGGKGVAVNVIVSPRS